MSIEFSSLGKYVVSRLNEGQSREAIEKNLLEEGHDEKFVKELILESVKLRDAQRRTNGLFMILGGAIICFTSFLLTITSTYTQGSFALVLYGLTSLGIIVVFAGLMKVF